jgi:sugar lactone lactonase YvrE
MLAGADGEAFAQAMRDGRQRFGDRDYAGAVAGYERALATNPGDPLVLYWLAIAAARGGQADAALGWLGKLGDADSAVVPFPDDFPALAGDPRFRAVTMRLAAQAARYHRATLAFRLPEPGLLVEGIAYDPAGKAFYAGAGTRRKLIRIRSGVAEDFLAPGPDLDSPGGLRVDAVRHRLWMATGTDERMDGYAAGEPERNALVEVDLDTGAIAGTHPLTAPGHHVLNDVAVDATGRPYATDTAGGQLYTLGPHGALVAVFDAQPYFRPNGIAADDAGGALLVADFTGVHRLDLATRTTHRLAQPRGSSIGRLDGMYLVRGPAGPRIVGIQTVGTGRVVSAALSPGLDAVTRIDVLESDHPLFDGPTTGAVVGDELYFVANSQLWAPHPPAATLILKLPVGDTGPAAAPR